MSQKARIEEQEKLAQLQEAKETQEAIRQVDKYIKKEQNRKSREEQMKLEQEFLLKVIKDKEQSYFTQDSKPKTTSMLYTDYMKNSKRSNNKKGNEVMGDGSNQNRRYDIQQETSRQRENLKSPIYTCFTCTSPGHLGVPCSKLAQHELFGNPAPDYLYPHDKIDFIATSDKLVTRDQASSPVLIQDKTKHKYAHACKEPNEILGQFKRTPIKGKQHGISDCNRQRNSRHSNESRVPSPYLILT